MKPLTWTILIIWNTGLFVSTELGAQTFTDVTEACGLGAIRDIRPADWWLSGLHFIDLDKDGDLDFFMSDHHAEAQAALNDGSGNFTLAAGTIPLSEVHIAYDIDEDEDVDLSMTYTDGGGRWWSNVSSAGDLNFTETSVTRGGGLARQQAMIDINGDGNVDWLRGAGAGVLMDFGDGTGAFSEADLTIEVPHGEGVTVVPADFDGDGDMDLAVEWGRYDYEPGSSRVYQNDGQANFTDITVQCGLYETDLSIKGVGDFDQDGDIDIIALEDRSFPPAVFLNDGSGSFTRKEGAVSGISGSANYASWGLAVMTDFDNDGTGDIIMDGRNFLHVYQGQGDGNFVFANNDWGNIVNTAEASVDGGFTFGDMDDDGDLDLAGYTNVWPDRQIALYRNDFPEQNWLRVRPRGLPGNAGAAGAKIRIYEAGTDNLLWFEQVATYCRQAQQSYYAHNRTERHFGLGAVSSVDVEVEFYPSGTITSQEGVEANQTVVINEDPAAGIFIPQKGMAETMSGPQLFSTGNNIILSVSSAIRNSLYDMRGKHLHRAARR
jgi:hypothetical protein